MTLVAFGGTAPARFGNGASVPTFPQTGNTYTDPTGAIVVPPGALDSWWNYRATKGAARGDVLCIGDSTMYGSGANYSLVQRLRDQATGATTGGPAGFGMIDGGKGLFGNGEGAGITYDAPEINGLQSRSGFNTNPDQFDILDGQFFYEPSTAAATITFQFRTTAARLFYSSRTQAGDFTYSVDGGSATTVQAYTSASTPVIKFIYLSGLTAGVTHTITVTNVGSSSNGGGGGAIGCWLALAPLNATGVVFNKAGTSGDTISSRFFAQAASSPWTQSLNGFRYQASFGLAPTSVGPPYTGAPVDSSQPAGGEIRPVLAMTNLGFNDLSNAVSGDDVMWTEYVKRFAGACRDAGCGGIVMAGQFPYNANWPTFGAARFNAIKSQAAASGLVFVDLFYPIAGPSLSYSFAGAISPHLTKTQYQAQADFLWNGLLGLTA